MAKTPKPGSRMAQARYDAAAKRESALTAKGWPASRSSPEYQAYLKSASTRATLGSNLKSKPRSSGKKK